MRRSNSVALALAVFSGFGGIVPKLAAQESGLVFTVNISNYADVDSKTLLNAEVFATNIFRKSGVETKWVIALGQSGEKQEETDDRQSFALSQLRLGILPCMMAKRFRLREAVMGIAPGGGANRTQTYVFYDKVKQIAESPVSRFLAGPRYYNVNASLVLGHAMAHEVGHVL